ncbi:MAG: hypothetical protein ACFFAO_06945 [Candidatus Hermodarchaeota archaeon]
MGKILQDIWIIDDAGIVLYNRVFNEKVDAALFGALISALNNLTKEILNDGLTNFKLKNKLYSFARRKEITFIVSSDIKYKEKNIYREFKILIDSFFENYKEELENWKGQIDIFSDFEEIFHKSLQDPVKKFELSFW